MDLQYLPERFDLKAVEEKRLKDITHCQLCENKFSKLSIGDQATRHCKKCAKAICQICSDQKR